MIKLRPNIFLAGVLAALSLGWIDYDDKVEKSKPEFGKVFEGFALRIHTKRVEFEQDEAEELTIEIRNDNERASLLPGEQDPERTYALYLVIADKNGTSRFSRNLLEKFALDSVAKGRIPPKARSTLLTLEFNHVAVARVDEFLHGMPNFGEQTRFVSTADLVPRIYTLKVILLSAKPDKRPDFAVASDVWRILLKPKSGDRMAVDEKTRNMQKWLRKMGEGAFGGVNVSSQLAALGEMAVDPLIEMADRPGGGPVGESRIWAIVTLCNIKSKKAEDYILRRIRDPVAFGDLAFLVWHSQGFHSQRVRETLRTFCEDAATGKPMPWEKKHGPGSRRHAKGSLEFAFKHFISIKRSITDATAEGVLAMDDPKIASFGLAAWQPSGPDAALRVLTPMFDGRRVHGNLKKAALNRLSQALAGDGFPKYDRQANINQQWMAAALWLKRRGKLADKPFVDCLRTLVFDVRKESTAVQRELVKRLQEARIPAFPVRTPRTKLPNDWVQTWRWALRTSDLSKDEAIQYLCAKARTRDPIPDAVKTGMLLELKRIIGSAFPLESTTEVNLDEDWPTCGRWLVENGYFKKK